MVVARLGKGSGGTEKTGERGDAREVGGGRGGKPKNDTDGL